jgi:hypothetical protein
MGREMPLTDQEKRYLNALKLFMERVGDPEHLEDKIVVDELSPEQARAMIVLHRTWMDDPPLFFFAYTLSTWISPVVDAWSYIRDTFLWQLRVGWRFIFAGTNSISTFLISRSRRKPQSTPRY